MEVEARRVSGGVTTARSALVRSSGAGEMLGLLIGVLE
jgi:hypothetical protein